MIPLKMIKISQELDQTTLEDIESAIRNEMTRILRPLNVNAGSRVAITVGSRGITNISEITAAVVNEVRRAGADPFIVPAMGSHGGATADGQRDILKEYGITEEKTGAPILSSMEVVNIGMTEGGIPVHIDKIAYAADHIIVVNRVKSHTEFHGKIESGLMKMMVIGLGNHQGAIIAHEYAVKYGYERTITEIGRWILKNAPVTMGLGIIENGYGKTAHIFGIHPENFLETEQALLETARRKTPKIPFDEMDILIVDECGKNISGTGMDTKVVGRIMNIYEPEVGRPKVTRIILRDLTEKTQGNAIGIGLADFITKRVADKTDFRSSYVNCITAVTPEKARMPIICKDDKEALEFALATVGPVKPATVKIVWIKNTSKLDEMCISQGLLSEVSGRENLKVIGELFTIAFTEKGELMTL